jgi:hypothetical protein
MSRDKNEINQIDNLQGMRTVRKKVVMV